MSLSDEVAELRRLLPELRALQGASANTATINVNAGGLGVAVSVGALLIALVAVVLQGQRISDLRSDMQTERLSREAMDNWTAQEVTAIRSYITNGKLQPMQARPQREPESKP